MRTAVLLIALLALIGLHLTSQQSEEGSLFSHRRMSLPANGGPHDDALTRTIEHGWPFPLVTWQRQDWYRFGSTTGQTPVPAGDWSRAHFSSLDFQIVFRHADPSAVTVLTVAWPWIAFQFSLLIILAALLAGAEWLMRRIAGRPCAQPS